MRKFISEEGLEENQLQAEAIGPFDDLPDADLTVAVLSLDLFPGGMLGRK